MPTTDQDARALTYLARRLRKETYGAGEWDEHGTYVVISRLVGQNLPMVVERVTRHASDPEAKTPAAINRPFVPDAPRAEPARPPKKGEMCETHGGHLGSCSGCAADRLADTDSPTPGRRDPEIATRGAALVRAALHPQEAAVCGEEVSTE